ncbi:substrate-binding domain-containing protein [Wenyingzhuangia sp. IMCC45574]
MNRIKDIAKKANVSAGTVDRVIHNRGGVSEKTRKKILKIIDESNYTVNPVASILASKKKFSIATLLPLPISSNDFWQTPKKGILDAAKEIQSLGFEIVNYEFDQFDPKSYHESFNRMLAEEPNAVLLAPILQKETLETIKQLDENNIPYVTINAETEGLNNISFIGQNSYKAGYLAGKLFNWVLPNDSYVLSIEIRRDLANHKVINDRIRGFEDYLTTSSKTILPKTIVIDIDKLNNETLLSSVLKKELEDFPNIKGIFVPSSKSYTIAKSISKINRKDIEIGGFDTTPKNVAYLKDDTINFLISQKPYQQGYDGIKLLFNYLINKKTPQKNFYSPIEVIFKENVDYL